MDNYDYWDLEWDKQVDINNFINDLGNIEDLSAKYLLIRISSLGSKGREQVLADDKIKNKLRDGILKESSRDFWRGFRDTLEYLSISELLSLYDVKTINDFFKQYSGRKYIFYAAMAEVDLNKLVESILNDDLFFDDFFKEADNFYSIFYNLDYDNFKKIILKMAEKGFPYRNDFICSIKSEYQQKLLEEVNDRKTILFMLPVSKKEVINDFFKNNYKASYIYDKVNLIRYALEGTTFNDDILKKKDFFERIKSTSFIEFRSIINKLEENNNVDIIERKVNDYYNEIINSYDKETGIFKDYFDYINNPDMMIRDNSYILSGDVVFNAFMQHRRYDYDSNKRQIRDKEELINELKIITSHKLSEVIIDALFNDNIYNVWLNLKEMLRYNNKLTDSKVIDDERVSFYKTILNFDNVSSDDKIALFNKLMDKRIDIIFYDDLRKLKDISYNIIKDSLYNVGSDNNNLNKELSNKCGVDVFDLRDKEYTMLIRGKSSHRDTTGRRRNCYSVISNDNSSKFGSNEYIYYYGYNSFDIDRVSHVLEQDSFSSDVKNDSPSNYVNRLMTPLEIVRNSSWYSEFDLVNPKLDDEQFETKKPDFLVVYEEIENRHIHEAKRLGIPIVLIKEKKLDKELMTGIPFDRDKDIYVDNSYHEMKVGRR